MTNTTANLQTLDKAARAAGIRLYESAYMSTEKALAQRQLDGRTHYADDNTLKFFGARINETRQDNNGLWFALRESVQPPHSARVHRWCIFDIFGQCERTEERSTGAGADKLLPALIASKDWETRTLLELERRAKQAKEDAQRTLDALSA
jgi:hypothetical protein